MLLTCLPPPTTITCPTRMRIPITKLPLGIALGIRITTLLDSRRPSNHQPPTHMMAVISRHRQRMKSRRLGGGNRRCIRSPTAAPMAVQAAARAATDLLDCKSARPARQPHLPNGARVPLAKKSSAMPVASALRDPAPNAMGQLPRLVAAVERREAAPAWRR